MDIITTLGTALGAAWTAGINLYATVAVLGLVQHYGLVSKLPGGMDKLDNWWVIGVALFLYVVEFFADKIPYVDTVWDALHTFIRVPAGAVLALAATADLDPTLRIIAVLLGGGLALSTHGTKATVRAAANVSPEPFSNWTLSLAEDALAIIAIFIAILHPLVALVLILAFVIVLLWILPKVLRRLRRLVSSAFAFLRGRSAV